MPTFQDILLVSEIADWLNLLEPLYRQKPEKVFFDSNVESDSKEEEPEDAPAIDR
jgi:hypothetical protein